MVPRWGQLVLIGGEPESSLSSQRQLALIGDEPNLSRRFPPQRDKGVYRRNRTSLEEFDPIYGPW